MASPDWPLVARSLGLFALAGLAEIGGGYLVWQWMRNGWPVVALVSGGVLLVSYGFIPPLQPVTFGRAFAAYGAVFIVLSLAWAYVLDHQKPDVYDFTGAGLCLVGVAVIMYAPR